MGGEFDLEGVRVVVVVVTKGGVWREVRGGSCFSLSFQLFIVGTVVDAFSYGFYFSGIWGSSYLRVSVTRSLQFFFFS